jgi:hypothetical protein
MKRNSNLGKTNCINLVETFCSKKVTFLLLATIIGLFSCLQVSAQGVKEYHGMIAQMKASENATLQAEASHIESLAFSLQPKVYIENGIETYSGDTDPICVNIDAASINKLYAANTAFKKVELISIRLKSQNELNFVLNYSSLQDFQSLKYVEFLCDFNCEPALLKKVLSNFPENGILIFYIVSIEE